MSSMASISFKSKNLKGPKKKIINKTKGKKEKKQNQKQIERKKRKKLLILPQIIRIHLTC